MEVLLPHFRTVCVLRGKVACLYYDTLKLNKHREAKSFFHGREIALMLMNKYMYVYENASLFTQ